MKIAYLDIETNYIGKFDDSGYSAITRINRITVLGMRVLQEDKVSCIQLVRKEVPGLAETLTAASKAHPLVAHIIKTGITGLVGGAAFAKGSKLAKLLLE